MNLYNENLSSLTEEKLKEIKKKSIYRNQPQMHYNQNRSIFNN
jgi:hypothetical protein